jgi:hypothetical protein
VSRGAKGLVAVFGAIGIIGVVVLLLIDPFASDGPRPRRAPAPAEAAAAASDEALSEAVGMAVGGLLVFGVGAWFLVRQHRKRRGAPRAEELRHGAVPRRARSAG